MNQITITDAEFHTLIQHEQMSLDTLCSHFFQRVQSSSVPEFCGFDLRPVRWHSVQVNAKASDAILHSMTSPLKETAGIACPTAMLQRVHY